MARKAKVKPVKFKEADIKVQSPKVVFSFSELRPLSYSDASRDGKFFIKLLERLKKLSGLEWKVIERSGRHSFGTEILKVSSLSKSAQEHTPVGIESFLVFRSMGDNHVFLGYRDGNTFQVVFIEYQFGDIYKHG